MVIYNQKQTRTLKKEDKDMKRYANGMKATEFNKTQIENLKQIVKLERWFYQHLLNLAGYYGYDDNRSVEEEEQAILKALNENQIDAQITLNRLSEKVIKAYGLNRSELDRADANSEITEEEAEQKIITNYPECNISFTEEGCAFKFNNKPRAKEYTYKVNNMIELAKKLRVL